ncbi:MAG: chlorophyll synthesis pathway protein BchC [Alphaproteobacteria bacterium]
METIAVVLKEPESLVLDRLPLCAPGDEDVVVDIDWTGISTGTEKLLWSGQMPSFPGMGYPLVPGYESVGRVVEAGTQSGRKTGERVFVPGANCFGEVRGLFGGAASTLVVPGQRVVTVSDHFAEQSVLIALAATAYHAVAGGTPPDLIVGHGVLGRLLARIAIAIEAPAPVVWENNPIRQSGAEGYDVIAAEDDTRMDYDVILDVSGDSSLLDTLIGRLAPAGEVVLAGFYPEPLSFSFPPAFMREARIRVAAEWKQPDLEAVNGLIESGRLSLDGLVTHCWDASQAKAAYETAFSDPACLKMVLDWRTCS